ncbi:MAG TPA: KpsF/GutQ family sugar-phosphate isomerase [Vampirovibrionales bacterium]
MGTIKTKNLSPQETLKVAQNVINLEAKALNHLSDSLDQNFLDAVDLILNTKGRVVVTGMGKSGHVASKIAATLASTGTTAFFVHPAELLHGDFGMIVDEDIVIGISNSGETSEVTNILVPLKRRALQLIAITSNPSSTLGRYADITLNLGVEEEACPLKLAPTTSTTATLALGDALAVSLMEKRGFSKEDFAKFHPGGSLGRQLLQVKDVMRSAIEDIPIVYFKASLSNVLQEIEDKKLGFTCIVGESEELVGLITDGDLRRAQMKYPNEFMHKKPFELMTENPQAIDKEALAYEALKIMEEKRISDLIIVSEQNKPIGIIDLKDLLKVGIY